MSRDDELCDYLTRSGTEWTPLEEASAAHAERAWRDVFGNAFVKRPRLRQGAKAENAYQQVECHHYRIVPFTSKVDGLPIQALAALLRAYDCRGPLAPLGRFHLAEFFVCPPDLAWTMVHTHEDHAFGGPYFIRAEWIP